MTPPGVRPSPFRDIDIASARAAAGDGGRVTLAGRMTHVSYHADEVVLTLRDGSGRALHSEIDCVVDTRDRGRPVPLAAHPGDHLSITGDLAVVAGNPVLITKSWTALTTASGPPAPPDAATRQTVIGRSRLIAALRDALASLQFIEVETALLSLGDERMPGRPFRVACASIDQPLFLRTSADSNLKRLIADGFDRVFEIARSFRDEPPDATHDIEYTLLEAYVAYDDYVGMRSLVQQLVCRAAVAAIGTTVVTGDTGQRFDLAHDWAVVSVHEAVSRAVDTDVTPALSAAQMRALALQHGVRAGEDASADRVLMDLYEHLVEKETVRPTFYTDFPAEFTPLARTHPTQDALAQKWDLVMLGREIGAAYSELVDASEQRRRLRTQRVIGQEDLKSVDRGLLDAMAGGMPPTAGIVLGVERLLMTLTGGPGRAGHLSGARPFGVLRQIT